MVSFPIAVEANYLQGSHYPYILSIKSKTSLMCFASVGITVRQHTHIKGVVLARLVVMVGGDSFPHQPYPPMSGFLFPTLATCLTTPKGC
jgi:hypothetical protein